MKRNLFILIPVLLMIINCGASENTATAGMAGKAEKAPSFKIADLNGNILDSKDYEGKVVIVNFWATWCPPCLKEIPDFIKAYDEFKDEGLEILGLAVSDTEDKVRQFVKNNDINYPVAMATDEIVQAFQPGNYIPSTIIIDSKGEIAHRHVGVITRDAIAKYLEEFSK